MCTCSEVLRQVSAAGQIAQVTACPAGLHQGSWHVQLQNNRTECVLPMLLVVLDL
jgi:hypothetical protein